MINRLILTSKLLRIRFYSKQKTFSPDQALLIFSDPRGGSTWLAELINNIEDSMVYWEPLFLEANKQARELKFGWRQHIPEVGQWEEAKTLFDDILSLKILNEWTLQKVSVNSFKKCKYPIVKLCRGNYLAGWLCNSYDFKFKPIVLLRHPFAVASSQLKQGGWNSEFNGFRIPDSRFNDVYLENKQFLDSLQTKEEALVATWCITNRHFQQSSDKWQLYFYEEMIRKPQKVVESIFATWRMPMPDGVYDNLSKESSTSVDLIKGDHNQQLMKWRKTFSEETITKLQLILDHFGVNIYSKDSLYPNNHDK